MQVKEIMSTNVVTVNKEDTIDKVAGVMQRYDVGAVPVLNGDSLCGMVTDRDLVIRCVAQDKEAKSCMVEEVMTPTAACLTPEQTVEEALKMMSLEQVRRLPVLHNGKVQGIISLADIARSHREMEAAECLSDICCPHPVEK